MEKNVEEETLRPVAENAEQKNPDHGKGLRAATAPLSDGERVRLENRLRAWKARWE